VKKQVNIKVLRVPKKKPKWSVRISTPDELGLVMSVCLPGEFQTWSDARSIANVLAIFYRKNGYDVALDTKTCRKPATAATQAYGVA